MGTRKSPNILVPAAATTVALLNFVVCLGMPQDSPAHYGMVWSEVGLITLAVVHRFSHRPSDAGPEGVRTA
jgi:hypothetical protein